jgi:TonB-dependent starch-binding outer membrane protein SusC
MKKILIIVISVTLGFGIPYLTYGNLPESPTELQQTGRTITGHVTDEAGESLIGVTVQVKGTATGVITDADGKFVLKNVPEDAILIFSFVGLKTQEVPVLDKTEINVTMGIAVEQLDEVVIIGYGTQRKVEITSAVANVQSDDFLKGAVRDAAQLIQGKVAGLNIVTPSGDPTANSQIVLRGSTTLKSSTAPLVLIDGIPGDVNTVAPEDVESIDVLKDGSAAAIYGTRGTNGVILITTKGSKGIIEPTFEYSGYVSTQQLFNLPEMLSAAEVRQKITEGAGFADYGSETDWVGEVTRDVPVSHVHNFILRGGQKQTNYVATFNYKSLQGIILESDNKNINGRVDLNHSMFDNKLRFNVNLTTNDNKYRSLKDGGSFDGKIFRLAEVLNPTAPVKDEFGTWFEQTAVARFENPLALIYESTGQNQSQTQRLNGSVILEPVKGLELKALTSYSKYNSVYSYMESKKHISTVRDAMNGYATKSNSQSIDRLLELTAQYTLNLKAHKVLVLAGYSFQDNQYESSYMQNWDFPPGAFSYVDNIGLGNAIKEGGANMISSNKAASNLIGFFGRLSYSYKDKYLLLASLRHEASSRFVGAKEPWGTFPSVSVGWRISEENFMKGLEFINYLKLRAGYGVTGTAPDALFLGVPRLGYMSGSFLVNGEWVPSLEPVSNYNPYLRWEVKKEQNYGVDFGLLKNRISGSFDYYIRRSEDMIYDYPVPVPPNFVDFTTANVGVMENKGFEIMISAIPVNRGKLRWETTFTYSHNKNLLVSLSNDLYQLTNDYFDVGFAGVPVQSTTHRVEVGQPIGNIFGYKVVGVNDKGKWLYEDTTGVPTPDQLLYDRQIIGNGMPKTFAAWNNTLQYGNFDLNITMRGAFGFQILNFYRMHNEVPGYTLFNQLRSTYDEVYEQKLTNNNPVINSYYVEQGDYWKVDNITLGYNFSTKQIKHVKGLRLYASVLNGFIFTNYKGMDPEVTVAGLTPGNDDMDKYPTTRTYTLGVNVVFY